MEPRITEHGANSRSFPVLSGLGCVDALYDLAKTRTPEAREELIRIVALALDSDLSLRESELVADVLIKLLKKAERDMRMALSEKLSTMEHVPLRLILNLANDEIDVASPVLQHSVLLDELDLLYIIKSKTAEYWRVIAMREELSMQVVDVLADTKDLETALALVDNSTISFSAHTIQVLSELSKESQELVLPFLGREEVDSDVAAMIYDYVGAELKDYIAGTYDVDIELVESCVDDVKHDLKEEKLSSNLTPDVYEITEAKALKEQQALSVRALLSALRKGHIRLFVAQLSVYTNLPASMMEQVVSQESGKSLAIIARAFDFGEYDFTTMFTLIDKMLNFDDYGRDRRVKSVVGYYKKMEKETALDILKIPSSD